MKKIFAAFVAVATIAGSLAATPVSAQRGVAAGVRLRAAIMNPPLMEQVAGAFWQLRMGEPAFL
jgi:hypothetical protein